MSIATLSDIIAKVRRLTGTGNSFQLTDSQIIDYINSFYLYDFPSQFRGLKLKDKLTFNTIRGIDTYAFDAEHYTSVEMPCYCSKREIKLFTDPWAFFGVNFNWQNTQNLTTADGTAGPYAGNLQAVPIIRSTSNNPITQTKTMPTGVFPAGYGSQFTQDANFGRVQNLLITTNVANGTTLNVTDDGAGNLIGDCISGTINYDTGAIANLVFNALTTAGQTINVQYNPTQLSIPLSVMFFQNQFTLRPVPDKGYTIEMVAYRMPSQALLGSTDPGTPNLTGVPELLEWWETLAFGAAKKVYEDRLDPDGVALMATALKERYDINLTRTCAQIGKSRVMTIYQDQLTGNFGASGWGFGNTGV